MNHMIHIWLTMNNGQMGYHGIPSGQAIRGWEILTSEGHPSESGKERSHG
jgi:hypothetical protein